MRAGGEAGSRLGHWADSRPISLPLSCEETIGARVATAPPPDPAGWDDFQSRLATLHARDRPTRQVFRYFGRYEVSGDTKTDPLLKILTCCWARDSGAPEGSPTEALPKVSKSC